MKTLRPVFLLCLALSCAPRPGAGEFLSVQVTWERAVVARCFVVRATGEGKAPRTTRPMLRGTGEGPLEVAIFRDDAPPEVSLEALGYADDACSQPTGEHSEPRVASFVTSLSAMGIELRVVPGLDVDGDGSPTPIDCDDGNPLIHPGLPEACGDTFDNDCDDAIDCADADCLGKACGTGRACVGMSCGEADCSNDVDDDGDGLRDCADPDCAMRPCGTGGTCGVGRCLAPTEARCDDGDDNDGNGLTDCADPQCSGRACDDGNGCTQSEICQGTSCTGGSPRDCALGLPLCLLNLGCDAGLCRAAPTPAGTTCSAACTLPGLCDGDGGCSGAKVTCPAAPGPCFGPGTCQASLDGGCSYPVIATNACTDGDGCTIADACQSDGGCVGTRLDCTPTQECRPWAHTCTAGACDFVARPGLACDGGSCNAAGGCVAGATAWPYGPSNFDPTASPGPDGGLVVDCLEVVLDTEPTPPTWGRSGCSTATRLVAPALVQLPNGWGEAVFVAASSLFVDAGSRLTVVGTRPVIFAVTGDVTIAGELLAAARLSRPAAGADLACSGAAGTSGTAGSDSAPGGSGGAFGSAGGAGALGAGANAGTAPAATAPVGSPTLEPLQGGCSGGAGAGVRGGPRGRAGGALQVSSMGTITLSGLVGAPGEGGEGAGLGSFGGGGAGSGGGVLLEARSLQLTASGRVLALGGAGGEGSSLLAVGDPGSAGSRTTGAAATGGSANPRGGDGGGGASRTSVAGAGAQGLTNITYGGGGGGGAGLGRVRFNVTDTCTLMSGSLVSPPQSTAPGGACP